MGEEMRGCGVFVSTGQGCDQEIISIQSVTQEDHVHGVVHRKLVPSDTRQSRKLTTLQEFEPICLYQLLVTYKTVCVLCLQIDSWLLKAVYINALMSLIFNQ